LIAAVVLAAGGSRRLGRSKQLVRRGGRSLVRNAAEAALGAGCEPVVVVLGAEASRVAATLEGLAVRRVDNPGWAEGIASSIRAGIAALSRAAPGAEATVLLACDQPRLDSRVLTELIAAWRARDPAVTTMAGCAYSGVLGTPAIFGREAWPELATLQGDRGAGLLLRAPSSRAVAVPWADGALDVDVEGDLPGLPCDDTDAAL